MPNRNKNDKCHTTVTRSDIFTRHLLDGPHVLLASERFTPDLPPYSPHVMATAERLL